MNDEYYVRWGVDGHCLDRSDYMTRKEAEKFYNKIKLSEKITWKECGMNRLMNGKMMMLNT